MAIAVERQDNGFSTLARAGGFGSTIAARKPASIIAEVEVYFEETRASVAFELAWAPAWAVATARSGRSAAQKRRQFGQRPDLEVGAARQALAALAVAIAPDDPHAEIGRPMRVPGVGGLERNRARREMERIERVLIDVGVGLEGADGVDREDGVEHRLEPGALDQRLEHHGRAVGENGGFEPGLAQAREHGGNLGERLEAEIEVHQALA